MRRVLSIIPTKYEDMWTGAKGFYKVEPVVADGGQVILYAPHITEISAMHPEIKEIGYHCRDYFVKQWDRFRACPGVCWRTPPICAGPAPTTRTPARSARVTVTLATGIPEERVRAANLDYLDPADVDPQALAADPDTLVVPQAGEVLFRLR